MPGGAPVDWLIVGLGNPGAEYDGTRHNIGFEVANVLARAGACRRPKSKYRGLLTEGRTGPGGPRVAILLPQTYMNEAGDSVGPARGAFKVDLDHVLVLHDEIDLPFGEIRARIGGGLAGHNGLKSLKRRARLAPTSRASGSASAARRRPIPTASPPTSSAASASRGGGRRR